MESGGIKEERAGFKPAISSFGIYLSLTSSLLNDSQTDV
jgi:hypothetical protein